MTSTKKEGFSATAFKKPRYEVADIFRLYGAKYKESHSLSSEQAKVMGAIMACRTARLGGHMEKCDWCGHEQPSYNSCRNRHCPKCQTLTKEKWLEARKAELLPVGYFHLVFTMPHELNEFILYNRKETLNFLFKAVSKTLLTFGEKPKKGLGGKVGFISVLHTWDQKLGDHFHIHCLIPSGAISPNNDEWIEADARFLFSVKALSMVFRSKYLELLQKAFRKGTLKFPPKETPAATKKNFLQKIRTARNKNWVVYAKRPFSGPEKVLEYLGRYTHKVAIANCRILDVSGGNVTFSYQDRKKDQKTSMMLSANEFIRRFLLHVLPFRFMKIRYFGFLANKIKQTSIRKVRELVAKSRGMQLQEASIDVTKKTIREMMLELTGRDIALCPCCKKGTMKSVAIIGHCSALKALRLLRKENTS